MCWSETIVVNGQTIVCMVCQYYDQIVRYCH